MAEIIKSEKSVKVGVWTGVITLVSNFIISILELFM